MDKEEEGTCRSREGQREAETEPAPGRDDPPQWLPNCSTNWLRPSNDAFGTPIFYSHDVTKHLLIEAPESQRNVQISINLFRVFCIPCRSPWKVATAYQTKWRKCLIEKRNDWKKLRNIAIFFASKSSIELQPKNACLSRKNESIGLFSSFLVDKRKRVISLSFWC